MSRSIKKNASLIGLGLAVGASSIYAAQALAKEQFYPSLVYRTGEYADSGAGFADGVSDYMTLINERDGGINGVRLRLDECETGYATERGVECYERLKNRGNGATVVAPLSTGIIYALIPRAREDGVVLHSMGYGRADAADGRVMDWVFMVPTTYWSSATIFMKYVAEQEGGFENLAGKTIAHVYLDSAYGREPLGVFRQYAEEYGFTLEEVAVSPPGVQQRSVWRQIRRMDPDWISLYGWGVMNPTSLSTAARMGVDRERIVGGIYAAQDDAVVPAGSHAVGYKAVNFHGVGDDYPVYDDLREYVYQAGLAAGEGNRAGTVAYNRGLLQGAYLVEAWRQAQEEFGVGEVMGREETKWAWNQLTISPARSAELGMEGLMPPVNVTCSDHEGGGLAMIQQWDGEQWNQLTDWMEPDRERVFPLYRASAERFAESEGIEIRTCD